MKKKLFLLSLGIIALSLIILKLTKFQNDTLETTDVIYALTVIDTSGNTTHPTSIPAKGAYRVSVSCSGGTGKWLYDEWKLSVNATDGVNVLKETNKCNLTFTAIAKTTLANKVIGLNSTTQGTGKVVAESRTDGTTGTDYRYEGKNPNNYVWFNNELWRIIGVFGNNTHGQSGNLVKIIKEDSIGTYIYADYGVWATDESTASAELNILLNSYYYNATNGTSSSSCYTTSSDYKGICDFSSSGIKSNYRSMIQQASWKLGPNSASGSGIYPNSSDSYKYERTSELGKVGSSIFNGYIGLMYPSDYGYSVLSTSCVRTTPLEQYNTSVCAGQSWLFGIGKEWLITPATTSQYIRFLSDYGSMGSSNSDSYSTNSYLVRPTLYLKSTVYVVDGNGSASNPYIIMN